ncbi:MAG UNVERIFIED_CONTAM: hypothetical protein LVQ98_07920 [Rickettsiaceae bacterium]
MVRQKPQLFNPDAYGTISSSEDEKDACDEGRRDTLGGGDGASLIYHIIDC